MAYSTLPGYQRHLPIRRPKLDAIVSPIEHWLDQDMKMPRKQRYTAKRVFDRLRDERGFTGGYTIIKDYMRERDQRRQDVFVPLSHPPGHGQADFGDATVVIGGAERKAHFFVLDLSHSDGCYARAYPAAVSEAWVDGHIHAFAFLGPEQEQSEIVRQGRTEREHYRGLDLGDWISVDCHRHALVLISLSGQTRQRSAQICHGWS